MCAFRSLFLSLGVYESVVCVCVCVSFLSFCTRCGCFGKLVCTRFFTKHFIHVIFFLLLQKSIRLSILLCGFSFHYKTQSPIACYYLNNETLDSKREWKREGMTHTHTQTQKEFLSLFNNALLFSHIIKNDLYIWADLWRWTQVSKQATMQTMFITSPYHLLYFSPFSYYSSQLFIFYQSNYKRL